MYLGIGAILIIAFAWWLLWSKICDIEQKQFKMNDEITSSLKHLEDQLEFTQSMIERIEENIPELPKREKNMFDHWEELDRERNSK
ncbi:hypothetical protein [Acinetobacter sp. MN12]|uniref:hypothetical protein n=1 Tax=Acinetobacter sp. MN12 TaxID=1513354 RepID=UPI00051B1A54|nr:hypothetical protein [Acinetobacter sp. MN12]